MKTKNIFQILAIAILFLAYGCAEEEDIPQPLANEAINETIDPINSTTCVCFYDPGFNLPLTITSPIGANPDSPVQLGLTGESWTITWRPGRPVLSEVTMDIYVNDQLFSSERITNSGHAVRTTPTGPVRVVLTTLRDRDETSFNFTFTGNLN